MHGKASLEGGRPHEPRSGPEKSQAMLLGGPSQQGQSVQLISDDVLSAGRDHHLQPFEASRSLFETPTVNATYSTAWYLQSLQQLRQFALQAQPSKGTARSAASFSHEHHMHSTELVESSLPSASMACSQQVVQVLPPVLCRLAETTNLRRAALACE